MNETSISKDPLEWAAYYDVAIINTTISSVGSVTLDSETRAVFFKSQLHVTADASFTFGS